jgi:hypothetical protein
MHTVDGGIVTTGFSQVLGAGYGEKESWKYIRPPMNAVKKARYIAAVHEAFGVFRKCLPSDYAREPRNPFDAAHDYKTAEMRVAATRFLPALLELPRMKEFFEDEELTDNYMNLLVFCRLVNHFSTKPMNAVSTANLPNPGACLNSVILHHVYEKPWLYVLAQEMLKLAQKHLVDYLAFFIRCRHYHLFTPLIHFATHVVEDVARFGCGAGHMSAYPFENQLSVFGQVRYKHG